MARLALIGSLLFALQGSAAEAEPPAKRKDATDVPAQAWIIPAIEAEMIHFAFLAYTNLVSQNDFGLISLDSIASHFDGRAPWSFDKDYFLTNMFGHPYQGSLAFTAARSAGLSFWSSTIYAAMSSLTWELFFEVDAPSINDQLTTTIGGSLLGEVLHRSALMLWQDPSLPRWSRVIAGFLLEPFGGFNRWLFASDIDESDAVVPTTFAMVSAGVSLIASQTDPVTGRQIDHGPAGFNMQAWFTYGVFDPRAPPDRTPFSHFDLSASVTPSVHLIPLGALFIRGMLYGKTIGLGSPTVRGVWGLFGQYDFAQPELMRVSSIGAGPGTAFQWHFSEHGFLQTTAVVALSPFDSIGNLGLDEEEFRDYHIGPGFSALGEVRLVNSEVAMLRAVAREWLVIGAYTPQAGYESMTQVSLGAVLKLGWRIGVAAEVVASVRVPKFDDATYNRTVRDAVARVSLCYLSDEHFGVLAPVPNAVAE